MFKDDIVRIKDDHYNRYWIIIKDSDYVGYRTIRRLKDNVCKGISIDKLINCNREYKLKKICSKLEIK